jgi:hypothetical protein
MKLIERVKAILLTPRKEWPVIEQERATLSDLFLKYVAILAAIPEVAHLIGLSLIGAERAPIVSALLRAVIAYLVTWAMVYIIAIVINLLAPRFGGTRNFSNALKLSVYSHTPLWLAGIFLLLPGLRFLLLTGAYGIYLFAIGAPRLTKVPEGQTVNFTVLVVVCACGLLSAAALAQRMLFGTPGL